MMPGDRAYIITLSGGQLFLGGSMLIERIVPRRDGDACDQTEGTLRQCGGVDYRNKTEGHSTRPAPTVAPIANSRASVCFTHWKSTDTTIFRRTLQVGCSGDARCAGTNV